MVHLQQTSGFEIDNLCSKSYGLGPADVITAPAVQRIKVNSYLGEFITEVGVVKLIIFLESSSNFIIPLCEEFQLKHLF